MKNAQFDFGEIFIRAPNPYVILDDQFVIVEMNDAYLQVTMRRREDIAGRNMFDAFPSDEHSPSQQMLRRSLNRTIQTGDVDVLPLIPYPIARPDGTFEDRFWSATHTPFKAHDGRLFILQHTVDVTELTQLRQAAKAGDFQIESGIIERAGKVAGQNLELTQEREYLRSLFAQAPSFMAVLRGKDHVFELANKAYLEIIGRTDILGKSVAQALPEVVEQGFVTVLDNVFASGEPFVAEGARLMLNRGPGGAGELRYLDFVYQPIGDADGSTIGIFVQGHDVTEQRVAQARLEELAANLEHRVEARTQELLKVQEALRQSQKMEAIGNLAGGIAHDFNNLLQVMQGSLQLLEKQVHDERGLSFVNNALSAARRGAQLASQLLAFGRRQPLEPKVINLGRLVRDMDELLRRSIGEGIEVQTVVSGGLWNTLADPTNVETALLNLAINARDAMAGHGRLTIELGNAFLDDEYTRRAFDVTPGQYVMLAVTDTGSGIPAEIIDKVFDPFFSTKPEGKGTGLGLSMVYGFAKQSGGHVKIYSEPGKGTTVRLYLPRALAEEQVIDRIVEHVTGGAETILIVEDDDAVRETAADLLRDLGYRVLLSRDAGSALAVLDSGVEIDLVFTDVVMPGTIKSTELAERVRATRPRTAVLFNSGYTENSIVHDGKLDTGINFLGKPYSREQLARKVRQVLDARTGEAAKPARVRRVLLCEDEPLIRMVTIDMLEGMGIEVVEAATAAEALAAMGPGIDLLISDVSLPDGSGVDLAEKVRAKYPDMPVVFATGHQMKAPLENSTVLAKPFEEADLARALGLLPA
ncbi:MAG: response regulator [Rhizobium sp.]|nr:response regulator [Rhizobium sp.]